jgi:hypothetical protein
MGHARKRALGMGVAAAILLLSGGGLVCAESGEGAATGTTAANTACLSGMKWTGGDSESPEMHPGSDCIACHASGEGPRFLVAGTVYQKLDEPIDCYGAEGAVVRLTDGKGKLTTLTTNKAGNFMLRFRGNTFAMPFTAKVMFKGNERVMATPQSTGNCAGCHTARGAAGAPGRILLPSR